MSSTSAVSVLAQGLRELRDFAEGPDGEELRERTGLTAEQIDTALGGEHLPTREVTLALVEAWEGDVEAWREYWGQISALAEEDEGEQKTATPTPPEPSLITPMVAEEAEEAEEHTEAQAEASEPEPEEANAQAAKAQPEAMAAAAARAEDSAKAHTEPVAEAPAEPEDAADPTEAEPEENPTATRVQPGSGSAELKPVILARAEEPAESDAESEPEPDLEPVPGPEPKRVKRSPLTRIGVPILLFALGVGVGAFGDHALNSKQSSKNTAASVPPVSTTTSRPSHTAALSPSGSGATSSPSGTPSSAASNPAGSASTSGTSTVAPGTVLGAYVGIQLASGYSVNFLADPYHPAVGTANGPDTMGFFASSFVDGRFYADRVALLDPTDTGSYTSCLNDTRYQHDVLLSQISTGSSYCITTNTGHLVLVTVRRMPSSTDANPYAVLDVTVWQGS